MVAKLNLSTTKASKSAGALLIEFGGNIVRSFDQYTAEHQERVAIIAEALAEQLRLPLSQREAIYIAAKIHDVGKIFLPMALLQQNRKLTVEEYEILKLHVTWGADKLRNIDFPWPLYQIVEQHHERLDGSGYPKGLRYTEIRIEAQVLAVADSLDAMVAARPYNYHDRIKSFDEAINEIEQDVGTKYNPQVIMVLRKTWNKYEFSKMYDQSMTIDDFKIWQQVHHFKTLHMKK